MVEGKSADVSTTVKRKVDTAKTENAPAKRSRVSRACDQCRAGRERCDGAQPTCQTCQSQDRVCSYVEQPKKRGIQPNYIRTLELTLAWIFSTFPDTESHMASRLPYGLVQRKISGKDNSASERLHRFWRESAVCKQIDQLLSGSEVETYESLTGQASSPGQSFLSVIHNTP